MVLLILLIIAAQLNKMRQITKRKASQKIKLLIKDSRKALKIKIKNSLILKKQMRVTLIKIIKQLEMLLKTRNHQKLLSIIRQFKTEILICKREILLFLNKRKILNQVHSKKTHFQKLQLLSIIRTLLRESHKLKLTIIWTFQK